MALVTGYAVYFSGGQSEATPGDGVSGGSLILDFDPGFAIPKARGVVSFPELGKRDGGFFALEGVSYFVPDDSSGLPIDYEGRVLAVTCKEATAETAAAEGDEAVAQAPRQPQTDLPVAQPVLKTKRTTPPPSTPAKPDPSQSLFYDMADDTDYLGSFQQASLNGQSANDAPDLSLSASLRSAFQEPLEASEPPQAAALEPPQLSEQPQLTQQSPPPVLEATEKAAEIDAYFAPESREIARPAPSAVAASDDDDWAVYLAPQPTIQSHRPVPQVIEIITQTPESEPKETQFDPAIDLVLAGEEKQTFSLMAQEVVETVESFEGLKRADEPEEDPPLLIAELRKLDPNMPDKRPRTLLPWIKRDETEDEMVERLTIKSQRHAV